MCAQHKKMKTSLAAFSYSIEEVCLLLLTVTSSSKFYFFKVRRFLQKHGTTRTLQYYKRQRVTSKRYSKSWLAGYGYVER
jgi:hypothetical protein